MSILDNYSNSEIKTQDIEDFLKEIKEILSQDVDKRSKKKWLKKLIKKIFEVEYIQIHDLNVLFIFIEENKHNIKFYKKESVLNFDTSKVSKFLKKICKVDDRLKKIHGRKVAIVKDEINDVLTNYLGNHVDNYHVSSILSKIENYIGKINPEQIEVKQIILQEAGDNHMILPLVVKVNDNLLNVDVFIEKENDQIVDSWVTPADKLNWWNKKSTLIIQKLYHNQEAWVKLEEHYILDNDKFNLEDNKERTYVNNRKEYLTQINFSDNIRKQVKEWKYNEQLKKFITVTKEWNKIFKQNREELVQTKIEKEQQQIIDKNAQAITNLFANNATLQWTMDFDNSFDEEGIKWYFSHFLALKPTMRFSKINKINILEKDRLIIFQWDYDFTTVDKNGDKRPVEANFMFTLQKNKKTGKWAILRLKSTYEKTENMFDKLS